MTNSLCIINTTEAERAEWSRMAQDAYRTGHNFYGHRYSAMAAIGKTLRSDVYDGLMINYRKWLVEGWGAFAA